MRLLVTGASGFLGRYVVAEALRRGHDVRAVARAGGDPARYGWAPANRSQIELVRVDLRSRRGLVEALRGVDAVIHLAAAKSGDVYEQYAGTVVATENLVWAMGEARVNRLVHISTFSVYDYMRIREWSVVDEEAPVERDAFDRDGYAHTKLVQEHLVRDAARQHGWALTIVRPGIIYGKDNLFNCNLGMQPSKRLWVRTGAWGRQPLTYVENCAEAIVLCVEKPEAVGQTFNVVDDGLPSQRRFMNALRRREKRKPFVLPVSWTVMRMLARSAWLTNKLLLGSRAKVPSILVPCRLHARIKPLRYTNRKIKDVLGWRPRYGLEEAIDRSLADGEPSPPNPPEPPPENALRVGYLTGQYPRASDTFIQREVTALRRAGVHVQTFAVRRPADAEMVGPEQRAERDRTSYLLPACPLELTKSHAALFFRRPGVYLRALRLAIATRQPGAKGLLMQLAYFLEAGLLARRVEADRLSHVHNHFADASATVAMLASALGGFTYSLTFHGPAEFVEARRWRIDEKVRRARFVNCISDYARRQTILHASVNEADVQKLHIVHCGVDPAAFTPRQHAGTGWQLLFVGRLAPQKALDVMLRSLAVLRQSHRDVHLSLAGDGPERAKLEALARELGVGSNVTFLGYQSQRQVRDLLAAADVFVLSSVAEGVPVVLMEAMAACVPVVATRIAGIPELVHDGANGFLVPPGDPETLAARAATLLDDPELRNRCGAAGRAKVEREFNLAVEGAKVVEILTDALRCAPGQQAPHGEGEAPAEPRSAREPRLGGSVALPS